MSSEEIFNKVRELIAEQFAVEEENVTQETSLEDDLGADSVDLVDLAVTMEQEFSLRETDEAVLGSIRTVGDIVRYISEQTA